MSDTDIAYTRDQVYAALKRGYDLVDAIADSTELAEFYQAALAGLPDGPELTPADVGAVLNRVAGELTEFDCETSDTIWITDVINLAVNAIGYVLEHPAADLYDVIIDAHAGTEPNHPPEGSVKGDTAWNDALYATVTGWIA